MHQYHLNSEVTKAWVLETASRNKSRQVRGGRDTTSDTFCQQKLASQNLYVTNYIFAPSNHNQNALPHQQSENQKMRKRLKTA